MTEAKLDQLDTATARLTQAGGVLDLLAQSDIFKEVGGESALSAIWATQALIEQAKVSVIALRP